MVRERGIPFALHAPKLNKETQAAMLEAECIAKDPTVKKYDTPADLFEALQNEV